MIPIKKLATSFSFVCMAALLTISFPACGSKTSADVKKIGAGDTWEIAETIRLSKLTIAEDAAVKAPEGSSVTLTVNGVETGIAPGTYEGYIALTVTEDILVTAEVFGSVTTHRLRAAIDVENGAYIPEKSVSAAVTGGPVTDESAKEIGITSVGENFNGIVVSGNSRYSVENPKIHLAGNGFNDFVGVGAGILTRENAEVTVSNAEIVTDGVVRVAICANGSSTLTVRDSYIETGSPALPETISGMMSVPWVLGLTGTCRSTMATEAATVNYTGTHIKAKGWGALSTDAVKDVKLTATGCIIETVESGYGAYADGNSVDTFSGCTFNVTDYALIMTQGAGVFTDGTVVNSGRFGVMNHSGRGGEKLVIEKGSVFNTGEAAIQVKSSAPDILVDGATLNSKNGILLQAMMNDDPNAGGGSAAGGPPGGGAMPEGEMPGGAPDAGPQGGPSMGGLPTQGGMPGGAGDVMPPGGMPMPAAGGSGDIKATFRNVTLTGDIITSMTELGDMIVSLESATITGAITTAAWKTQAEIENVDISAHGAFSTEGYGYAYLIGRGIRTYCETDGPHGLKLFLDGNSSWVVAETSWLTGLTVAEGATVKAPEGSRVTLAVDGRETPIGAGVYEGRISLTVTEGE